MHAIRKSKMRIRSGQGILYSLSSGQGYIFTAMYLSLFPREGALIMENKKY